MIADDYLIQEIFGKPSGELYKLMCEGNTDLAIAKRRAVTDEERVELEAIYAKAYRHDRVAVPKYITELYSDRPGVMAKQLRYDHGLSKYSSIELKQLLKFMKTGDLQKIVTEVFKDWVVVQGEAVYPIRNYRLICSTLAFSGHEHNLDFINELGRHLHSGTWVIYQYV